MVSYTVLPTSCVFTSGYVNMETILHFFNSVHLRSEIGEVSIFLKVCYKSKINRLLTKTSSNEIKTDEHIPKVK